MGDTGWGRLCVTCVGELEGELGVYEHSVELVVESSEVVDRVRCGDGVDGVGCWA